MEKIALLQEKKDLLLKAINRIDTSKDTLEDKLDSIENNEQVFQNLRKLQIKIQGKTTRFPSRQETLEEEIRNLLQTLHKLMDETQKMLRQEQREAKNALGELNKSKRIAGGYIQVNQGSVYVDKDFM